jgi:hypothetical protein
LECLLFYSPCRTSFGPPVGFERRIGDRLLREGYIGMCIHAVLGEHLIYLPHIISR